ncbi:hypothetical protein P154DRAFT_55769 [Amniculicola lignicola CBS 123094]|uniref:Uncharacterized protein n=1 Tax=Amniculicola lignicola CBS 123094 TaxID=1392246 RepID=A0A6A5WQY7_9PLEO|nr:hypothetical protein P154DRAFT_55769 [Amniculicola lignicola CBS 123094]
MSQYPSAPPAGAYVPPSETPQAAQNATPTNPQQQYYQQQQQGAPYGSGYAPAQKKSGGLSGMFNQAVTTGKPLLNKLGKTINSKVGGKPAPGPPQHLESYQNYQQHQQQQNPPQNTYSPQTQQQQWQPQQQQPQQQQNQYGTQQSPYQQAQQSNYGTPASGTSGQSNYFPPQPIPGQSYQGTQQPSPGGYGANQYNQGQTGGIQQGQTAGIQQSQPGAAQSQPGAAQGQTGGIVGQTGGIQGQTGGIQGQTGGIQGQTGGIQGQTGGIQGQTGGIQQGQYQQGQLNSGQPQDQQGQYGGQQSGVTGTAQSPTQGTNMSSPQGPSPASTFPNQQPQQQQQQQQWAPPSPLVGNVNPAGLVTQPVQPANPTPPPQVYGVAPAIPMHPNQQNNLFQQSQGPPQIPQQQWAPMSPMSPQGQGPPQISPSTSPPPPNVHQKPSDVPPNALHQTTSNTPSNALPPQPVPAPKPLPEPAPTSFVAELPADLGSLSLLEQSKPRPTSTYQAYQPGSNNPTPSSTPGFSIARRAVSTSSLPIADPWRIADPISELPTREFYIIADLLFDGLDRKCEPQNTGMLEASKILESWKVQGLDPEAFRLFEHDSYSAIAKLWALEGIPHILVPSQPSLTPSWNFQPQTHSAELRVPDAPTSFGYPMYVPALNRAGWYKYFFLEMIHETENLDKLLPAFCADTYNPTVLNQPNLQKQDRSENPGLAGRVNAIRAVMGRVCQETAAGMQASQNHAHVPQTQVQGGILPTHSMMPRHSPFSQ